ncbi:3-isopropylmalate dehydratase large subunit [Frankliniella fusca]|uniref:3-isopropylmalate dehydratase large subunit n=1 Tax=Frankliniella fusca TaxID=407009 RepID=A0AAE1I3Y3_9NEOP|nr:3-isopropylmalate dehydratase large subunit [Frankliniella fusca]
MAAGSISIAFQGLVLVEPLSCTGKENDADCFVKSVCVNLNLRKSQLQINGRHISKGMNSFTHPCSCF